MTTFCRPGRPRTRAHDLELVLGGLLRVDVLDAGVARHLVGDLGPVAGDERDVGDPGVVELPRKRVGAGAEPVAHHDHGRERAVDADEDLGAAGVVAGVVGARVVVRAGVAVRLEPAARADGDAVPVDDRRGCRCPGPP